MMRSAAIAMWSVTVSSLVAAATSSLHAADPAAELKAILLPAPHELRVTGTPRRVPQGQSGDALLVRRRRRTV